MFNRLKNLSNRMVLGILFVLFAGGSIWSLLINLTSSHANFADWGESWLQNFSTEMFGAFLTFILLELIVGRREKRTEKDELLKEKQEQLLRQMGSRINAVAIRAVEELRILGLLEVNSFQGVNLGSANLQGAYLYKVHLPGVYLFNANLREAYLDDANFQKGNLANTNLEGASLRGAELQNANLGGANMQNTGLEYAELENVNLIYADLQEADLHGANIKGANLAESNLENSKLRIIIDDLTTLPDGTHCTSDNDMRRFTDPTHPNFWRSDDPRSPAYRGKSKA